MVAFAHFIGVGAIVITVIVFCSRFDSKIGSRLYRPLIKKGWGNEVTGERPVRTDGGDRRETKSAPPEDMLAAPANHLNTEPHPQAVTKEILHVMEAADDIVAGVENPREINISPTDTGVEKLTALAEAVQNNEIKISTCTKSESGATMDEPVSELQSGVSQASSKVSVESGLAKRLLEDLDSVETRSSEQISRTLRRVVTRLEEYHELDDNLNTIVSDQPPERLGQAVTEGFCGVEGECATEISNLGKTIKRTASDLDSCQSKLNRLKEDADAICRTAENQTEWSPGDQKAEEVVDHLATALEDRRLWFTDETSSIAGFAAAVESQDKAESKPAKEFLEVLKNAKSVPDHRVEESIANAVKTIDQTETVTTRLEGVDSDDLVRTADRLQADCETRSSPVFSYLRERISKLKQTATRSSETDPVTLYAARQELRYYDRSLIPKLSESSPDSDTNRITERIETVDEQRSMLRQSYPTEYPDCDHTIPIYFFDLVDQMLEHARDLQNNGESKQANGLVDAAELLLEWIEGLYETHSYFVLLRQLRG